MFEKKMLNASKHDTHNNLHPVYLQRPISLALIGLLKKKKNVMTIYYIGASLGSQTLSFGVWPSDFWASHVRDRMVL